MTPRFPPEIYEDILAQLPPEPYSDSSVLALCNCALVSRLLRNVASLSHLWRPHYTARYAHSSTRHDWHPQYNGDYRLMYAARRRLDKRALSLLDDIIARKDRRRAATIELVAEIGGDVWDLLASQADRMLRAGMMALGKSSSADDKEDENSIVVKDDWLAREYWSRNAMGAMSRLLCYRTWKGVVDGVDISFEEGLTMLSSFWNQDVSVIPRALDYFADKCRDVLRAKGLDMSDIGSPDFDVAECSIKICDWMRSQGFDQASGDQYHALAGHFPHMVLDTNRKTLPMSLVWVFVALARRLGLDAHPVGFPGQVLALVRRPDLEDVYVDVFESATAPILTLRQLHARLDIIGAPHREDFTRAATTREMIDRAVRNIMRSARDPVAQGARLQHSGAVYAGFLWEFVDGEHGVPRGPLVHFLGTLMTDSFPLDVGPILMKEMICGGSIQPELAQTANETVDMIERSAQPVKNERRRHGEVKHFVGMVMVHLKYDYHGVITGWDTQCDATEEWIIHMGVDKLVHGRRQPFYHVYTIDGSTRYVAEENIRLLESSHFGRLSKETADALVWNAIRQIVENNQELGKVFKRVELRDGKGRFVLAEETLENYPEDEEAGRTMLGF